MSEGNPFIDQAKKRVADWEKYTRTKKLAGLFEKAKEADKTGQIFYEAAISAWSELTKEEADNPYYQTAGERYNFWNQYKSQIDRYNAQLQKFEEQRKSDIAKLKKSSSAQSHNRCAEAHCSRAVYGDLFALLRH